MTQLLDSAERHLARIARYDPEPRLRALREFGEQLEQLGARYLEERARAIHHARHSMTWRQIGEIFGVSAQRAEAMSKQGNNNHQEMST